jgi:uncharacterized protein (TIGR02246 family)
MGRDQFAAIIEDLLQTRFKGSTHHSRVIRIRFSARDVAIVDGEATLSNLPSDEEPVVHPYTDVFTRREGTWLITDVRAYLYAPAASEDP